MRLTSTARALLLPLRRRLREFASPALDRVLRQAGILENAFLAAKFLPLQRMRLRDGQLFVAVEAASRSVELADDGLPIPPADLQEGWGSLSAYLGSGQRDVATMLQILADAGAAPDDLTRVLDFGCASGRLLRGYPRRHDGEYWGVDIKARHVEWCQANLSPPYLFATTTTLPHLPFEDDYFHFAYCASVFTHIGELADAWLLELRRVLRPTGLLYITIHDENSVQILLDRYPERGITGLLRELDAERGILSSPYASFAVGIDPWTQVFYNRKALTKKWSRFMEIVSETPEAMDYQTALLLRKPADTTQ